MQPPSSLVIWYTYGGQQALCWSARFTKDYAARTRMSAVLWPFNSRGIHGTVLRTRVSSRELLKRRPHSRSRRFPHRCPLPLTLSLSLFVSCRGFKRHTRTNRTHTRATSIICRPLKCVMMRVKHVLRARVRLVTKYASHGNVRKRERVRGDGPAVRFSTGIPASISWAGVSWHFRLLRGHRGGRRWFSLLSSRW